MHRTILFALALALAGCSDAMRHGALFSAGSPASSTPEDSDTAASAESDHSTPASRSGNVAKPDHAAKAAPESTTVSHYRYYPAIFVYFDPARKLYFFPDKKKWKTAATIPARFKIRTRKAIVLDLATDKPFMLNKEHRVKYPPPPKPKVTPKPAAAASATPVVEAAPPATAPAASTPAPATASPATP